MIGSLKKLEAFDGGSASIVTPSATSETPNLVQKKPEPQDRRLLSVPNDGWIGGPGRSTRFLNNFAAVRG